MITNTYKDKDTMYQHSHLLEMFGKGFQESELAQAYELEVLETTMKDKCADYCEFVLKDQEGSVIATRRVDGY